METKKRVSVIHYIVVLAFCFLFQFVPGPLGISQQGMCLLGCFIGAIYGWITIDMLWPSLVALVSAGFTFGMTQVMAATFGSATVLTLVLCMGSIGIAMKNGAFNWLVSLLLNNKFMQGKPWLTIWIILVLAFPFGPFNPIIMMIIFGAFVTSMLESCHVKKNSKLAIFLYLGCALSLMNGQILFPFFGTGLVFFQSYNAMFPNIPIDMVPYLGFMIVMGILIATVYMLVMRYIFRVDAEPLTEYCKECEMTKCTRDQKVVLLLFVGLIILNLLGSLPLGAISVFVSKFGIAGYCMILCIVAGLLPDAEGKPLANLEELFHMANWGQVCMVAVVMLMATYMSSKDLGITAAMATVFKSLMGLSPWVFIIVSLVLAVVLTNVANNMIIAVMVMPFLVNYAQAVGINTTMCIVLLWILVQLALANPAASPVTAVAMTQELADASEMSKTALKILPIMLIIEMAIAIPVSQIFFPL